MFIINYYTLVMEYIYNTFNDISKDKYECDEIGRHPALRPLGLK